MVKLLGWYNQLYHPWSTPLSEALHPIAVGCTGGDIIKSSAPCLTRDISLYICIRNLTPLRGARSALRAQRGKVPYAPLSRVEASLEADFHINADLSPNIGNLSNAIPYPYPDRISGKLRLKQSILWKRITWLITWQKQFFAYIIWFLHTKSLL